MKTYGSVNETMPLDDSLLEGISGGLLEETKQTYLQSMANAKKAGRTLDEVLWSVESNVRNPEYRQEIMDFVIANWDNV